MRLGVQERGLTLAVDVGSERVIVWGDSGKLVQVFGNIIDNAMKYTPKGGIMVTLKKVPERNVARVEVRDTGIGMNVETLGRVFEKFSRGDNARVVNTGGSGLGLFIVKTFVEAHKGKIWPESDGVGKGTNFFIELPLFVEHSANTL
jgi:signal transduction histidine kinase